MKLIISFNFYLPYNKQIKHSKQRPIKESSNLPFARNIGSI